MPAPPDEPFRTADRSARPSDDGTRVGSRPSDDSHSVPEAIAVDEPAPTVPGYEHARELKRGGMGVVYTALDATFKREVAIKTLLPDRPFDPDMVRRFVTESHVTARLQHPAVPPVFAVGQFRDGRPYMVMKLVRGRDLRELLKGRKTPADGLPRFLAAFEQVCQAVGYAHSKGVLHRDLKPANVMVGEFAEVQVMDWGLAKQVVGSEWLGGDGADPVTVPADAADATRAGIALGTPAYMAPEQARGDWPHVGPWSDVFALGGILADILTGRPPFYADTALGTLVLAGTGDVSEAFARLDACGADPALVALTKRCLAPDPQLRPADGKALAEEVAAYRAGVEARLRKAEAERAAAAAKEHEARLRAAAEERAKRAAEERADEADRRAEAEQAEAIAQRKKRRAQLLLAAAVALLVFGAGAFAWWRDAQAAERDAEQKARAARDEAERAAAADRDRESARAALGLATGLRAQRKFREATDAIVQAEKLAAGLDDLLPEVRRERADIAFARDLDAVRARKWTWISNASGDGGRFDVASVPGAYADAFAARGLAITRDDPAALARRITASAIRADILRALDDWALTVGDRDRKTVDAVLDVAFRAGPPADLATKLRDPDVRRDAAKINKLIASAEDVAESIPATLYVAKLLEGRGGNANVLLAIAQAKHPLDFDITFELAHWHHTRDPRRLTPEQVDSHLRQAIAHYRTARALRPDHATTLTNLGMLLGDAREGGAAVAVLREAIKFHPDDHIAHFNLGGQLLRQKRLEEAAAEYRETIRLSPNYAAAHSNLGAALGRLNRHAEAAEAMRTATDLDPNDVTVRSNYGLALQRVGDIDGALREYRRVLKLDSKYAPGYLNLGVALELKKDRAGALAAYREAVKLDPKKYADLAKKLPPEDKK